MSTATTKRMTVEEFGGTPEYDDSRVELIDGYITRREEMKPRHVVVTERMRRRLEPILPVGWFLREDKPILLSDWTEPRPDFAVVRGDFEMYEERHPEPHEVAMAIEVSNTTRFKDRGKKWNVYAQARIAAYWIVDVVNGQIEVYTNPAEEGYDGLLYQRGESVPVVIDGNVIGQIAVTDILPGPRPAPAAHGGNGP